MTRNTVLHDIHKKLGAKMGAFAGYDMPLYYAEGVLKEHEWVRAKAGLFDVSHMGQLIISGSGAAEFLETLTPSAFQQKKPGRAQYTVLLNAQGGIIDDLIVTRMDRDRFFAVVNAGCKEKDIEWIRSQMSGNLKLRYLENKALIAMQGPAAEKAMLETLGLDLSSVAYMHMIESSSPAGDVLVSRLGYTGEDGFEISIDESGAVKLWTLLLEHADVKPIGLAARDSLRLEMGYPLYGHDIDQTTSPVEAGLEWIISRKTDSYFGFERIQSELAGSPARVRVGIKLLEKGIAREGSEVRDERDRKIGILTSGGFSPSLKEAIGQGYIEPDFTEKKIFIHVRGRNIAAEIVKMPFVPARTRSATRKEAA